MSSSPAAKMKPSVIGQDIERGLRALIPPGQVFEVRILETRRGTVSGYFHDLTAAAKAAVAWDGRAAGVYTTTTPKGSVN